MVIRGGPILVVEPEPGQRAIYARTLSEAGYDVQLAEAGTMREEAARAGAALVVAHLPDVGEGMHACRLFRTAEETRDMPLLVITRFNSAYVHEEMLRSGATAILMDPPRLWLLIGQVRRILNRFADRLGHSEPSAPSLCP